MRVAGPQTAGDHLDQDMPREGEERGLCDVNQLPQHWYRGRVREVGRETDRVKTDHTVHEWRYKIYTQ